MTEPIISVSGLRGIVGETLTPDVAIHYAAAFAAVVPPGPIVLARDSRPSGRMLAGAINSGLEAVGRATINAGIAATPTTGVLVRHLGAAGGIQITASHNPSPYNGLKFFSAAGRVIPAWLGERFCSDTAPEAPRGSPTTAGNRRIAVDTNRRTWRWSWRRSARSGFASAVSAFSWTRITAPAARWEAAVGGTRLHGYDPGRKDRRPVRPHA